MTNEAIAEKIAERMHQLVNLPSLFAEVERLRLIGAGIHQQIAEADEQLHVLATTKADLEQAQLANSEALFAATQHVDDTLTALYRPVDAPAAIVEGVAKLARTRKGKNAPAAAEPPNEEVDEATRMLAILHDPNAPPCAKCHASSGCDDCCKTCISPCNSGQSCRKAAGEAEAVTKAAPVRSLCADCLGGCDPFESWASASVTVCGGYQVEPDADQIAWRDSTCQEWRECPFTAKCFGPSNEEDPTCFKEDKIRELGTAALAGEKPRPGHEPIAGIDEIHDKMAAENTRRDGICNDWRECEHTGKCLVLKHGGGLCLRVPSTGVGGGSDRPCWNSSCAWSDLAATDHCDAEASFRAGRPVAECKCFVDGIGPTKGKDAAACLNAVCPSNDPALPTGCSEWAEVWECPQVVTAGWGALLEDEHAAPVDSYRAQHDAIVRAAIAAGDDINEHGVFNNPEVITVPLPAKKGYSAKIEIATDADGGFHYGYEFKKKDHGTSGAPSVTGTAYPSRYAAISAAIIHLKRVWPEAWTEAKLKAVRNAVAEFEESLNQPEPTKQEDVHDRLYRPSNGTEGDCFHGQFCDRCTNDDPDNEVHCDILTRTAAYSVEDAEYPREWTYDNAGHPTCTAFTLKPEESTNEAPAQEEEAERETAVPEVPAADSGAGAAASVATTFAPLDEPVGDCELCMGYGVIEGELFNKESLIPCTCEAGKKVAGETWSRAQGSIPKCCEDCNLEDPDCASCHLPDMDAAAPAEEAALVDCGNTQCQMFNTSHGSNCRAITDIKETSGKVRLASDCNDFKPMASEPEPAELPKCANGNCTATGKGAKEVCLRIGTLGRAPKDCTNFVPLESCSHNMLKRSTREDGATVCDLCGKVLKEAGAKPEPAAPAIDPVQAKRQAVCTHPKVFREVTEVGEICKVCRLNLSQPSLL